MIGVSSFKFKAIPEVLDNQDRARKSWEPALQAWCYTNELNGFADPPTIKSMAVLCTSFPTWSCILNADIVLHPQSHDVWDALDRSGATCAISRRWEFYPDQPKIEPRIHDLGLDIFCAVPEVWKSIADNIPDVLLLGHIMWDTWVLQWMNSHYRESLYDFSECAAIFHPKHGGRGDQSMNRELCSMDARKMGLPRKKLFVPLPPFNPARNLVV